MDPLTIAAIGSAVFSGASFTSSLFGGRRARRAARRERRRQREELAKLQYEEGRRVVREAALLETSRAYDEQQARGAQGRGSTIKSLGIKQASMAKMTELQGKNSIGVAY